MAMTSTVAKILTSSGVYVPNVKTRVYERQLYVEKSFSRLLSDELLCSRAELKAGLFSISGERLNPIPRTSRIVSTKGMRIRGSQSDGGVADSGFLSQYVDNSKAISTIDHVQDSNDVKGSAASGAALTTPVVRPHSLSDRIEDRIERAIFDCRFLTLFGVVGSLLGSMLCFLQGSLYVIHSFKEYIRAYLLNVRSSQVILYLVEAVDVYLMGTVMLIFGMGLYELFVSTLNVPSGTGDNGAANTEKKAASIRGSNLFGLFTLKERPKWLEIRSLEELKTKLGHVIVMILLVGMFEKSKRVPIHSGVDLLFFAGSILLASSCLYLLNLMHHTGGHGKAH